MTKNIVIAADDPSVNEARMSTLEKTDVDIKKQLHKLHTITGNLEASHKEILGEGEPYKLKLLPTLTTYCKIHVIGKEMPCVIYVTN